MDAYAGADTAKIKIQSYIRHCSIWTNASAFADAHMNPIFSIA